jgi:flotillin
VEQVRRAGDAARDVLVLQKLLPLAEAISGADSKLSIDRLTVLAQTRGANGVEANGHGGDWLRRAISSVDQLRAATGIDLAAVAGRLGAPTKAAPP